MLYNSYDILSSLGKSFTDSSSAKCQSQFLSLRTLRSFECVSFYLLQISTVSLLHNTNEYRYALIILKVFLINGPGGHRRTRLGPTPFCKHDANINSVSVGGWSAASIVRT